MSVCDTLKRFAKQRQKAYQVKNAFYGRRARAVSNIIRVCDYFKGKQQEWRAVFQIEQDIMSLLPAEDSNFSEQRKNILNLIQQSHERKRHYSLAISGK